MRLTAQCAQLETICGSIVSVTPLACRGSMRTAINLFATTVPTTVTLAAVTAVVSAAMLRMTTDK